MDIHSSRSRKERLLQFYREGGQKGSVASSPPINQPTPENDALAIDSPNFSPFMYLERLLREKDLSDLINEERVMTDQIKVLDSDMQTLMYDNYSKFISATDTIRMMKSDFKFVENEMSSLLKNMSSIASLSSKIKDNLQDGRTKLKTLLDTQQTLERLKHLTELPMRLQNYISDCNWETAIKELNCAKPVLKTYQNTPSFRSIRRDCFELVTEITNNLHERLDQTTKAIEISRYVEYLCKLGFGTANLSQLFLSHAEKHLNAILAEIKAECEDLVVNIKTKTGGSDSSNTSPETYMVDILHYANNITERLLNELTSYVVGYSSIFLTTSDEVTGDPGTILSVFSVTNDYDHTNTDVLLLEAALCDMIQKLMDTFFQLVRDRFASQGDCEDSALLVRALDRIHSHTLTFVRSLNTCIEGVHLLSTADIWELDHVLPLESSPASSDATLRQPQRLGDSIVAACRRCSRAAHDLVCRVAHARVDYHLGVMRRASVDFVTTVRQQLVMPMSVSAAAVGQTAAQVNQAKGGGTASNNHLTDLLDFLNSSLVTMIREHLSAQWIFLNHENTFVHRFDFREHFCMAEVRERLLSGILEFLLEFLEDMATAASSRPSGSLLLLLLAKLCLTWADAGTIEHLLSLPEEQVKAHLVPASNYLLISAGGGLLTSSDLSRTTTVKQFIDRYRQVAVSLLSAFVHLEGTNSAQLLRKGVEARDWLKNLEPRSIRSVVKRVIEDVNALDRQICQLFPSNGQNKDRASDSRSVRSLRPSLTTTSSYTSLQVERSGVLLPGGGDSGTSLSARGSDVDPALEARIRRLFSQKVDIFASVEPNRESLLWGIVRIGLKTLAECVRLQTFSRYGLQQIQVDCRYFQIHLWHFVIDDKLVNSLLDDVVYSAIERCIDPQLMEDSIVEAICDRT